MTESDVRKKIYKERRNTSSKLIPSKGLVMLATFIDIVLFFVPIGVSLYRLLNDIVATDGYIASVIVSVIIGFIILLGPYLIVRRTPGQIILGIMTIDEYSFLPISSNDQRESMVESFMVDMMHTDVYETFYFLNSNRNQTILMKKMGWIYVSVSKYNKWAERYLSKEYEQEMYGKFDYVKDEAVKPIFKD